jgi:hypothetical protein
MIRIGEGSGSEKGWHQIIHGEVYWAQGSRSGIWSGRRDNREAMITDRWQDQGHIGQMKIALIGKRTDCIPVLMMIFNFEDHIASRETKSEANHRRAHFLPSSLYLETVKQQIK